MCQTIRGVSYSLPKGIVTNYLLFVSFSGSQNVTYSIELDKSRPQEVLRRMFFLHENKTTFRTTQQVSLPKEDEWYCDFRHTVYLRVSSLERFSFPVLRLSFESVPRWLQRNTGDGLLLTQITGIYLWFFFYFILFNDCFIYLFFRKRKKFKVWMIHWHLT